MRGIISAIKFGILPPNLIRSMSVVEVQSPDTYDEDGMPIPTGVMDPMLGTLEPGQRCKTCGNTYISCPGHFGHIELAVPVIHIGFVKIIHELLRCTCRSCGRLLLSQEEIEETRSRLRQLKQEGRMFRHIFYKVKQKAMATQTCPHCGEKQLKIELEKPSGFLESTPQGAVRLAAGSVRQRLERIPDSDLELLDIDPQSSRPEWMVLTVLPVPPVYVRPSITLESNYRSEDDLTHKLVDILRVNQRLKESIAAAAPSPVIAELSDLLQYHVTTYINNETIGISPAQHRSGRILKTLAQRLKGKEGRFRLNLSGKRVDFSARTVISPDPNIDVDEVGVPLEIAMQLTVPEVVTPWNKEKLKTMVRNGPDKYPGAKYVIKSDRKMIRLRNVQNLEEVAESLEDGWIVERHLRDGDIVLFNRQPSLHRVSIMAHRVKVLPYKTFRLNLAVCTPYNADFDGDEMNLHVPQSEEAQAEARLLLQVQRNIISSRYGAPIIGAIRDFLTSLYLLTKDGTYIDKQMLGHLLSAVGYKGELPPPERTEPQPLWSGKQVFSLLLPPTLSHRVQSNFSSDVEVVIEKGKLVHGYIDKALVGVEKANSLLHRIYREYGYETAAKFLNGVIRLANTYINLRGFTFGIENLTVPEEVYKKVSSLLQKMEEEFQRLKLDYEKGRLEVKPGETPEKAFESEILELLSKTRDEIGSFVRKYVSIDNALVVMAKTGARGSTLNIDQMIAIVGQQAVRRERPSRGFTDRVLTFFDRGDLSPVARGFVYNSFIKGLNPLEFFFHLMGGRDGLVDTAVRTQQSGYMQRRLINALESLYVEFDGSVRMSDTKKIVQFLYGEDGVDPGKSDHGKPFIPANIISQVLEELREADKPVAAGDVEAVAGKYEGLMPPSAIRELSEACIKLKVPRNAVERIFATAYRIYLQSMVESGDPVGIIAAQSLGEPGTQLTLRTFHFAGVREQSILVGLPRLIEIIDARRTPSTPIMNIYLKPPYNQDPKLARKIASKLQYISVGDIVDEIRIEARTGDIILMLDEAAVKELSVTKEEINQALKMYKPKFIESKRAVSLTVKEAKLDSLELLKARILNTRLRGVKKIMKAVVRRKGGEFFIQTEGSNLREIMSIPEVDFSRVRTNDIHEVASVLGIEAARQLIVEEAQQLLREQGLDVDVRHLLLLSDAMTLDGKVRQVGRHGVVRLKSSVLARAAFEISFQTLVEAAVSGEIDQLQGNIERILIGREVPVGTGRVSLLMRYSDLLQNQNSSLESEGGGK
ncbi:MAG: DNA-directed RNA polymerase subunit A' [Nitrososphaerota archaeon]